MSLTKLFVLIVLSTVICAGQTTGVKPSEGPEPEAIGVYYYLDPSSHTLKRLPDEDWKRHNDGTFTITQEIQISGETSSFHISDSKPIFVFKGGQDETNVSLFQLKVKSKNRTFDVGTWKGRDFTPNHGLSVSVEKFGDSSYKLTGAAPLANGEYAIAKGPKVFTFSIGAIKK